MDDCDFRKEVEVKQNNQSTRPAQKGAMNVFRALQYLCFPCPLKEGRSTVGFISYNKYAMPMIKNLAKNLSFKNSCRTHLSSNDVLQYKYTLHCNTHFCRIDLQRSSVVPLTLAFKRLFAFSQSKHLARVSCLV